MLNARGILRGGLLWLVTSLMASCGGGGGDSSPPVEEPPELISIALSPLTVTLVPGGTVQLTVTGTYDDGSTRTLSNSDQTFESSDTNVATVSAAGVVTVADSAAAGETAIISVTDVSGVSSSTASSSRVTAAAPPASGPPTSTSESAATDTANNNQLCSNIVGFYWEIGNSDGMLASGSVGLAKNGHPIAVNTKVSIASASKWIYGTYIVQERGGVDGLTAEDIDFMHFTSGYANLGTSLKSSTCPDPVVGVNTVNVCLSLINPRNGLPYSYQNPNAIGRFFYDSGHLENHAGLYGGLGDTPNALLGPKIGGELGNNIAFIFTQPLMSGGIYMSASEYTQVLRNILSGALTMHDALGTHAVCTRPSAPGCNASFSPIPDAWHYSMAHWVEDDPDTNGDGAFSSTGAFGFYPWIDASKTYYGVISRQSAQVGDGEQSGYASAQCGRLIRRAWFSGVEQTGTLPTN